MNPWVVFVVISAAVMAAVLHPLWRRQRNYVTRADYDQAVFRDQLSELDRDIARGLIQPAEAEAARNEISRRILSTRGAPDVSPAAGKLVPLAALILLPLIAFGIYAEKGSPGLPAVPLQERLAEAENNADMPALIAKVEAHLRDHPDDIEGWKVLVPSYRTMERYADAADAYANILRLATPNADLFAAYGEMLTFANQGIVSAQAAAAFEQALKLDAKLPMARYFQGLGLKQRGKAQEALAIWQSLLADTPADAPWRRRVEDDIAASKAPGPTDEQVAAAQDLSTGDRQAMIRGMVDGLEQRLNSDGSDVDGWHRLIRARMVLGEPDKARAAYDKARGLFKDKPDVLASLQGLAKELGENWQ